MPTRAEKKSVLPEWSLHIDLLNWHKAFKLGITTHTLSKLTKGEKDE